MNAVVEKLYAYRDKLTRREDGVLRELSRLWLGVEARIQDELQALTQEIARRREAGEVIAPQIISSLSRYRHFAAQAKREIERYDAAAEPIIAEAQRANLEMGIEAANAALDLSTDQAFTRLHVSAFEAMAGIASDGTPLNRLLRRDFPLAFERMNEALVQGVTLGRGAKQVAADMVEASRIAFERSILIARTEMNRAYRFASTAQYRDSGVVTGFRRLVYKPTACFACLMMDGEYYPVEQELYDHPRGKCGVVPVVIGGHAPSWETGKAWFEKLPAEEQRRIMGAGRYELWKGGGVRDLRSMVWMKPNAQWGPAPAIWSLEDLSGLRNGVQNLGKLGTKIEPLFSGLSSSKIIRISDGVRAHIEKHRDQFNLDLAYSFLPDLFDYPDLIVPGNKKNSFLFISDFGNEKKIVVPVKVLSTEMWTETLYIYKEKRFEKKIRGVKPFYKK